MSALPVKRSQVTFVQVVVAIAGISYLLAGLALFFAPEWFFNAIGHFGTFNRHYAGDLGSFQIPLGVGLLIAARNPFGHRALIGAMTAGSVLHVVNHLYDDLAGEPSLAHVLTDVGPLLLLALLLLVACYFLLKEPERQAVS